ncbi:MAG TPA: YdeI/OmpD-associated family protein [bacterium]|jgi:uncharacterized protein YdeI (YjbR/CyaY-like superfamily)|nr:YdeI/OmpD-associated family protein [bacterium]
MEIGKTLLVANRKAWRAWLAKNHKRETEIWLIYHKKNTGKERISYNDAVEEALCYGWIDSTVKSIDEKRYTQRFSVRNKTSELSQMNKERIYRLIVEKKMTKVGLAAIAHVFNPKTAKENDFKMPVEIIAALKANPQAWKCFKSFPNSYKRIRLAFIESRKRHGKEFYQKALKHFVEMTAKNKRFGFVKEMK